MNEQTPILIPILASVITGLVALLAVFITNRFNLEKLRLEHAIDSDKTKSEVLRDRGEELYVGLSQWIEETSKIHLGLAGVMTGNYGYKEFLVEVEKTNEKLSLGLSRLEMIVNIYFPEVANEYTDLTAAGREASGIMLKYDLKRGKAGFDSTEIYQQLCDAISKFSNSGSVLTEALKNILSVNESARSNPTLKRDCANKSSRSPLASR